MTVAMIVAAVHEQVQQGAGEQEQVRQGGEQMVLVRRPEEEEANRAEEGGDEPQGGPRVLEQLRHGGLFQRGSTFPFKASRVPRQFVRFCALTAELPCAFTQFLRPLPAGISGAAGAAASVLARERFVGKVTKRCGRLPALYVSIAER